MNHSIESPVPILGFAARSGTGKTTLLTQLIPILNKKGLRIALVKYSHHDFDIDRPGKDSYRLREAGATPVLLTSPHRRALITELQPDHHVSLNEEIQQLPLDQIDLILVEGFKHVSFPKIELHRANLGHPLLHLEDNSILAIATDCALDTSLPQLDLNQPEQVAMFIQNYLETGSPSASVA